MQIQVHDSIKQVAFDMREIALDEIEHRKKMDSISIPSITELAHRNRMDSGYLKLQKDINKLLKVTGSLK